MLRGFARQRRCISYEMPTSRYRGNYVRCMDELTEELVKSKRDVGFGWRVNTSASDFAARPADNHWRDEVKFPYGFVRVPMLTADAKNAFAELYFNEWCVLYYQEGGLFRSVHVPPELVLEAKMVTWPDSWSVELDADREAIDRHLDAQNELWHARQEEAREELVNTHLEVPSFVDQHSSQIRS
jgi:hypothetical protein